MKSIVPFLFAILICSCSASAPVKPEPVKASPVVEQDYKTAEALAKAGNVKQAMPRLKRFVQQNPNVAETANAYYLMGQMHANAQQYNDALNDYLAIVNLPTASPLEYEATIRATRLELKLSRAADAEKLLERTTQWRNVPVDQAIAVETLRYETYSALKKNLEALQALVILADRHPQPAEREKFRAAAQDMMDSRLSEDELRAIANDSKYSFLQPLAKYRYGILLAEQHQYMSARDQLASAAQLAAGTELADRAQKLIGQIDTRNRVDSSTIGVVLPLSGKQAGIGYKALRGIQLGLGIYGRSPSKFKLAVIDSEGNPDAARRAVERLVQEDNVIAIVGGLLSKTATAEATKAQEFGVPAIMLSQKSGVTQAGDFIFRNSLTSQMQVQMLVDTAMNRLDMHRFAVLFPNDAYGIEFANLFWDEVRSRGGEITGAQPYDPQETDFRGYVQRLVGTYYYEDRADEYHLFAKAWSEKNPKRSSRQAPPPYEDLLPPVIDFDAVFIPDSAKAVGQIAPMLAYNNVTGVRLLGTNIWNSPGLITRGQKFVENAVFVDSYLASDPAFVNSEFFTNFKSTFDEEPGLTEVQAYDSGLMLRQLIASGYDSRTSLQKRMASLTDFPGALGRLSVNGDREFKRPLEALTIKDGHITSLENLRK